MILECQNLSYKVEEKSLLEGINLQLKEGEFIGLVGPNGSGKTTLLRCLSGYLKPGSGQVILGNEPLTRIPARERARRLSYITQENSQAFDFTVMEMLRMGAFSYLGYWGNPGIALDEQCQEALEFVGLPDMGKRYFNHLSGGEKQLVLFARALVQNAQILLLDEPTSNLDMRHELELLDLAAELCRQGKSVILSLHNLDRAAEYCHRIVLLNRGKTAALGSPEEVFQKERLEEVYQTPLHIGINPETQRPVITPSSAGRRNSPRMHRPQEGRG